MKKTSLAVINLSTTFFLFLLLFGSSLFSTLQAQITVTTPYTNSSTWTVPSKVSSVKVEAWGAGGAGGRTGTSDPNRNCGGGGGGAYTYHILSVNPGERYTITVGTPGISGGTAVDGGNTTFRREGTLTDTVRAVGGKGVATGSTAGAAGGAVADCTPSFNAKNGGNGGNGIRGTVIVVTARRGGGGGGVAGPSSDGGNGGNATIGTISANNGTGGTGNSGITGSPGNGSEGDHNGTPNAGSNYGGGGGGRAGTTNNANGGNGAAGYLRVTYTYDYYITSTTVNSPICDNATTATVTLTSTTDYISAASGYTVTYTIDGVEKSVTGVTATNPSGTAIQMVFDIPIPTTTADIDIEITNIQNGSTSHAISENNTATITRKTVPTNPGNNISGNDTICASTTNLTYTINTVAEATGYNWVLPTGWQLVAGQNTDTITVNVGTASGEIRVTPYNSCGNALQVSVLDITVNPLPVLSLPTTTIGCMNGDVTISVDPVYETYAWSCNTGYAISDPTLPEILLQNVDDSDEGLYMLTVTNINGCSAADTSTLVVNSTPSVTLVSGSITVPVLEPVDIPITVSADNDVDITFTVTAGATSHTGTERVASNATDWNFYDYASIGANVVTITAIADADGCVGTVSSGNYNITIDACPGSAEVEIVCPPLVVVDLNYNESSVAIPDLGSCEVVLNNYHADFTVNNRHITNDAPAQFSAGENTVRWILHEPICDNRDTCFQKVYVNYPHCGKDDYYYDATGTLVSRGDYVISYHGEEYATARVGSACWLSENLKNTQYADGREIPVSRGYMTERYPDEEANIEMYGRLYDWVSATDNGYATNGHVQGACPQGWAIPTMEMFNSLSQSGSDALKAESGWLTGNNGNNSTGFSLLPSGYYDPQADDCYLLFGDAFFWTTESIDTYTATCCQFLFSCPGSIVKTIKKEYGYSVRCIKL